MDQVTGIAREYACDLSVARRPLAASAARSRVKRSRRTAPYLASAAGILILALALVVEVNRQHEAQRYRPERVSRIADTLASGANVAVLDLGLDFRGLREEQIKRLSARPDLVVLGGSQWRDAGAGLVPDRAYLNLHVPFDYYDDALGTVEALVRHDKLPKDLVVTIRPEFFAPTVARADIGWQAGIANAQAMARRLLLPQPGASGVATFDRYVGLLSPAKFYSNVRNWYGGRSRRSTPVEAHAAVLHADGSVTRPRRPGVQLKGDRARLHAARADALRSTTLAIDPAGFEALDRLLAYLGVRNVAVHLVLPPFSPVFFERIAGSRYMEALGEVRAVTQELADRHGLKLAGSFDPAATGCTDEMFSDAEHAGAACLGKLLADALGIRATASAQIAPGRASLAPGSDRIEIVELPSR